MSFSPKARNTWVRQYYDDYVPRPKGTEATEEEIAAIPTIGEVADILGIENRHISDANLRAKGWVQVAKAKYYTTDVHWDGWDTDKARQALEEHLASLQRAKPKAKAKKTSTRSLRVVPSEPEDWSGIHFWEAVLRALEELGAVDRASVRPVEDIKAKLAEHNVTDLDRVGASLRYLASRPVYVANAGGKTGNGWYLTENYLNSIIDLVKVTISQWDEDGNPVQLAQPTYEEKPITLPTGNLDELVIVHLWEWDGVPFGAPPGTSVKVEARLPKEPSAEERLGLFQFVMKVREQLLNLI